MFRNRKIKVLTRSRQEWNNAVDHAVRLGAFSQDGDTMFNPEKTAMVIDGGAIKNSRYDYRPKNAPYDQVLSYGDFMRLRNGDFVGNPRDAKASAEPTIAVSECAALVEAFMDAVDTGISPAEYLVPTVVTVPEAQHSVIFKAAGIKYLQDRGVDFTKDGETFYMLDLKSNTAEEVTAQWVVDKGIKDMLDNEVTPFVTYLLDFELIQDVTFSRVKEKTAAAIEG